MENNEQESVDIGVKSFYENFQKLALNIGMAYADIRSAIGSVFEVAYIMKLKEDELTGIFLALEAMASKRTQENNPSESETPDMTTLNK